MKAAGAVYCRRADGFTATTCACDVTASLDDYRWLTGPAARKWLAEAASDLVANVPLVTLATRLRRDLSAERTHLVLAQVELRKRAEEKFTLAGEMFFTLHGLAQATDEPLARYKAARFSPGVPAADLCCGIGGDLIALASGRSCLAIDRDPIVAHLAKVNADVCGRANVVVECRDADAAELEGCQAWHIDPDRRPAGKRTVRVERFDPPWETIETLLERRGDAAVKLAAATILPANVSSRCQREWMESRGECRQQVAWFGNLARQTGLSAATVIDSLQGPATIVGTSDLPSPAANVVGCYVYEPRAAVRAAHLTSELCRQMGVQLLGRGNSYLTSQQLVDHPLATGFEVIQSLPFDLRKLREAVRELGLGPVEVKKRGVDIDPDHIRRQLTHEKGDAGVVLVGKIGDRTTAVIARRISGPP